MGFFSSVKKAGSQAGRAVQKAGKQTTQNAVNAAVSPIVYSSKAAGATLKAVLPVAGQAVGGVSGILRSNPELAGIAGGLLGTGSGFFGTPTAGAAPTGDYVATAPPPKDNTMLYVILGGAALFAFFMLRK